MLDFRVVFGTFRAVCHFNSAFDAITLYLKVSNAKRLGRTINNFGFRVAKESSVIHRRFNFSFANNNNIAHMTLRQTFFDITGIRFITSENRPFGTFHRFRYLFNLDLTFGRATRNRSFLVNFSESVNTLSIIVVRRHHLRFHNSNTIVRRVASFVRETVSFLPYTFVNDLYIIFHMNETNHSNENRRCDRRDFQGLRSYRDRQFVPMYLLMV